MTARPTWAQPVDVVHVGRRRAAARVLAAWMRGEVGGASACPALVVAAGSRTRTELVLRATALEEVRAAPSVSCGGERAALLEAGQRRRAHIRTGRLLRISES